MQNPEPSDIGRFRLRLAETIAWCGERASAADPKQSLRTPGLLPVSVSEMGGLFECRDPSRLAPVVAEVATERARRLPEHRSGPLPPAEDPAGGYLLIVMPNCSLDYGLTEWVSDGFFDIDDFPPWDTWVWYGSGAARDEQYLLCWVPPAFVELVHKAVESSPEPAIFWAAQYRENLRGESPLLRELHDAGWLCAPRKDPH